MGVPTEQDFTDWKPITSWNNSLDNVDNAYYANLPLTYCHLTNRFSKGTIAIEEILANLGVFGYFHVPVRTVVSATGPSQIM